MEVAFSRETRGAFPKELGLHCLLQGTDYDSLPQRTKIAFFRVCLCLPSASRFAFPRKLDLLSPGNSDYLPKETHVASPWELGLHV